MAPRLYFLCIRDRRFNKKKPFLEVTNLKRGECSLCGHPVIFIPEVREKSKHLPIICVICLTTPGGLALHKLEAIKQDEVKIKNDRAQDSYYIAREFKGRRGLYVFI